MTFSKFSLQNIYGQEKNSRTQLADKLDPNGTPPEATGGNQNTVINGYRYHSFSATGNLTVTREGWAEVALIGGGGGGSSGGGGGGGGVRVWTPVYLTSGTLTATVGANGTGASSGGAGNNGGASSFRGISVDGGGRGGTANQIGQNGGSGGGSGGGGAAPGNATGNGVGFPGGFGNTNRGAAGGGAGGIPNHRTGPDGLNITSAFGADAATLSVFSGQTVIASGGAGGFFNCGNVDASGGTGAGNTVGSSKNGNAGTSRGSGGGSSGECNGWGTSGAGVAGAVIVRYRVV